ncbi:uncharacterized protein LOC130902939 [Diorhabda carinulata]|uniref:uncharacterized protein LOC130902939 n=1 Tax=Diorhabda carinulata TaxID=1163345 RepID=UPI0025A024ED|nr:uncharacterized protein LOC130902939 [Diorhabda carinulata]
MHGFSDASEDAFGSCIYLRSIDANGEVFTSLLYAKSKAAPLKTVTLPRLELMAAVTLVRLSNEVKRSLRIKIDQCVYWSDSTVVLGWLKYPPNQLKPFVANRVAEIQDLSAADSWRHVPTKSNPADLVSRGVKPRNLLNNSLWWEGPPFLKERKESWPECPNKNENLPDIRKQKVNLLISCSENDFIKHFSDVNKLKRITAYIRCFYLNCKAKGNPELSNSGPLEVSELDGALNCLTKLSQGEFFHRDINKLNKNKPAADCKIISLNLFLDRDGILRVGGRLTNAKFAFEKKHPAILSSKSHLAELLVRNTHLRLMHAGPQHTLVTLRERYKPTQTQPIMAPLPEMRLKSRHPFEFVGVDYAGPMSIKNKSGRGYKVSKAYICLFVCCVTKAVHTELEGHMQKDCKESVPGQSNSRVVQGGFTRGSFRGNYRGGYSRGGFRGYATPSRGFTRGRSYHTNYRNQGNHVEVNKKQSSEDQEEQDGICFLMNGNESKIIIQYHIRHSRMVRLRGLIEVCWKRQEQ